MGKLVKVVVLLAILVGGIVLIVHLTSSSGSKQAAPATVSPAPAGKQEQKGKKEKPELQEKYGFAPAGGGE